MKALVGKHLLVDTMHMVRCKPRALLAPDIPVRIGPLNCPMVRWRSLQRPATDPSDLPLPLCPMHYFPMHAACAGLEA